MIFNRRIILASSAGLCVPTFTVADTPKKSDDIPTVLVRGKLDSAPITLSKIALSPDGTTVAYSIGKATEQKLRLVDLKAMTQKEIPLGQVFLTEMMWGSNEHILVRLRYFLKGEVKGKPTLRETRYLWVVVTVKGSPRSALPLYGVLTEANRIETTSGFSLVLQNRIKYGPDLHNLADKLAGKSLGEQLRIIEDARRVQEYLDKPPELMEDEDLNYSDLPEDFQIQYQRPIDEFVTLDFRTLKLKTTISLKTLASRYALTADGQLLGFSTYSKSDALTEVRFANKGNRKGQYNTVLTRKTTSRADLQVEGLGNADSRLFLSEDNRNRFFELDYQGVRTDIEGTGRPLFDGFSHRHIGFLADDPEAEPLYSDAKWIKIWSALKSMSNNSARLRVVSHAKDPRQVILSEKNPDGLTLYHFIDLALGRTELLTYSHTT